MRVRLPSAIAAPIACRIVLTGLAALSACRTAPLAPATRELALEPVAGAAVYAIDPAASEVVIEVGRAGTMAELGHSHLIAVHALQGTLYLHPEATRSRFLLRFPVAAMSVDDPALRAAAGGEFAPVVGDAARHGTRDHMLGTTQLDAGRYPTITLRAERVRTRGAGLVVDTRIRVRDHEALVAIPLSLERRGDAVLVTGRFVLRHADLGLTPYSVALGALRVAEEMGVRYQLRFQAGGAR